MLKRRDKADFQHGRLQTRNSGLGTRNCGISEQLLSKRIRIGWPTEEFLGRSGYPSSGEQNFTHLQRVQFLPAASRLQDAATVLISTNRIERVSLEYGRVHIRREHQRVHVAVVS